MPGTDAANQKTRAVKAGDGYRITGRKVWVANADAAAVAIVFASTRPGLRGQGVTAFLVPMDHAGRDTHGTRRLTRRPRTGVSGPRFRHRRSAKTPCSARSTRAFVSPCGRCRAAASRLRRRPSGIGEAALDEAIAYAKRREVFGQPIASYQAIQWMLADMATELEAARMLTLESRLRQGSPGVEPWLDASMAKLAASEAAHKAADKAMQILASAGYRRGSTVERLFRDVRATEIYQGTSEAQRMIIAASVLASS